jgi:septal ring factor EnvC (AmiA/AmiB activator)
MITDTKTEGKNLLNLPDLKPRINVEFPKLQETENHIRTSRSRKEAFTGSAFRLRECVQTLLDELSTHREREGERARARVRVRARPSESEGENREQRGREEERGCPGSP